jgi:hypothetical protein
LEIPSVSRDLPKFGEFGMHPKPLFAMSMSCCARLQELEIERERRQADPQPVARLVS